MTPLIQQATESYNGLSSFRRRRNRCRDYTFGRQWNDLIEVDGRKITEYEYILSEGNVPLKNNLIRRIVRNVLGVFRERLPAIMNSEYEGELATVWKENSLPELFCRTMEEFLISGMAIHRKRLVSHFPNGEPCLSGVSTEIVSPASFFFNTDSRDTRGHDLNLVGQIHKVDFSLWCKAFVKNRADLKKAMALFPEQQGKLKVYEIWRKEVVPVWLVHDSRAGYLRKFPTFADTPPIDGRHLWRLEEVWRYYFVSEDGTTLKEGYSPYLHGGHPFVMKFYPYLDGEIQSFVADMIDQQRYTNRLITLYDWVIRASAKGVLLIPEGSVSPADYRGMADQWGRFNGVIVYKSDPNRPEPKQISGSMSNPGISELLEIQLKMMEDVSGVNGILQGNTSGGNVSGELYNSQTANAMYSLSDLLETYSSFIRDSSRLDRTLLRQKQGESTRAAPYPKGRG